MPLIEVIGKERSVLAKLKSAQYWSAKAHEMAVQVDDEEMADECSRRYFKLEDTIEKQSSLIKKLEAQLDEERVVA